jgi:hypothetical protein
VACHGRRWLLVVGATLLVHAALLSELRWTWADRPSPLGNLSVQVRMLEPHATVNDPAIRASTTDRLPPVPSDVPLRGPRTDPRAAPVRLPAAGSRSASRAAREAEHKASTAATAATADEVVPSIDGDENPPLYRTLFSQAASARYQVTRGARTGEGVLTWTPSPEGYRLAFEAPEVGWTQSSEGGFDAAGLAPRRYVERTSRGLRATNFDADAGIVRFSVSSASQVRLPGSQDRLAWAVQLGAVLAANPDLAVPRARIVLPVAGVRAEAMRWDFVVRSVGPLERASSAAPVVHLVRDASASKDLGIDVWIDPALPALPVRVEWRTPLGGTVLTWERVEPPP